MRNTNSAELTESQKRQLEALERRPVNTDDIPEAPAESWKFAERGRLYRPVKQAISIRLDADVLDWFKAHALGGRYQSEINRVLRRHVESSEAALNHKRKEPQ